MPKVKLVINPTELLATIQELESRQTFPHRKALSEAVANSPWGLQNKVTPGVCILRIAEFHLGDKIATKSGKRGDSSSQTLSDERKQKLIAGRGKKQIDQKWIRELRRVTPERYLPIVDRIESGSTVAVLKLQCLSCTNYNIPEIRYCQIPSCPLYGKRAYK